LSFLGERLRLELGLRGEGLIGRQQASIGTGMIGAIPGLEVRMSSQLEIVEAQALKLTAEERAQLADRLITSLFEDLELKLLGQRKSSAAPGKLRAAAPS
jgi:hypothetical protein